MKLNPEAARLAHRAERLTALALAARAREAKSYSILCRNISMHAPDATIDGCQRAHRLAHLEADMIDGRARKAARAAERCIAVLDD